MEYSDSGMVVKVLGKQIRAEVLSWLKTESRS
jgi:hypothetical protein